MTLFSSPFPFVPSFIPIIRVTLLHTHTHFFISKSQSLFSLSLFTNTCIWRIISFWLHLPWSLTTALRHWGKNPSRESVWERLQSEEISIEKDLIVSRLRREETPYFYPSLLCLDSFRFLFRLDCDSQFFSSSFLADPFSTDMTEILHQEVSSIFPLLLTVVSGLQSQDSGSRSFTSSNSSWCILDN